MTGYPLPGRSTPNAGGGPVWRFLLRVLVEAVALAALAGVVAVVIVKAAG